MHHRRGQCSAASLALGGSSRVNCRRSRIGGEAELAQEKKRDLVATAPLPPFPHLFTSRSKPRHAWCLQVLICDCHPVLCSATSCNIQLLDPKLFSRGRKIPRNCQLISHHACLQSSPKAGAVLAAFYPFLEGTSPTTVDRLLMSQVTQSKVWRSN